MTQLILTIKLHIRQNNNFLDGVQLIIAVILNQGLAPNFISIAHSRIITHFDQIGFHLLTE